MTPEEELELVRKRNIEAQKLFAKLKQALEQYKDLLDIDIDALTMQTAIGYAAFIAMATSKYIADTFTVSVEKEKDSGPPFDGRIT